MSRRGHMNLTVFWSRDQKAQIRLRPRRAFVLFERGKRPKVLPITDPGTYEVDITELVEGAQVWPIVVAVVRRNHATAIAGTPQHKVDELIDLAATNGRVH